MVVINANKRSLLKMLSILLQYPDDDLILSLEELTEAAEQILQVEHRERCVNFLNYMGSTPLIRLQEEYTSTFDLSPSTCLNLTYHKWGDARERGNALVDFHQLYHQAGYESSTGDLPDYLPLVLEYLSLNWNGDHFSLLGQYCDEVKTVCSRLKEAGSVYTALLAIVADFFTEMKTMGV